MTGVYDSRGVELTREELRRAADVAELIPVAVELLDGSGQRVTSTSVILQPSVAATVASARLIPPGGE